MTWISIDEGIPDICEKVLVVTEYLDKGKPASEMFVGYLGEDGDLYSIPNDDNYGWSFKECVTFWMHLPESPIL